MKKMAHPTTVVAEIGQNHNGDMDLAKQLIDMAAMPIFDKFNNVSLPGVNAVKFTKRDLSEELTVEASERPYDSPHAFGKTYGEHREALEFSYDQYGELEAHARSKGLGFIVTLTSLKTIALLDRVDLDAIKVASRDLTNLPLLDALASTRKRLILSTGMGADREIDEALEVITKHHDDVILLHCVSEYPAAYTHINLLAIPYMKEKYPYPIGFSDHSIGIVMAPVAVAMGAVLIEKHITLSRSMKGSDHRASLEPDGLWRMVRDIRNVENALGEFGKPVSEAVFEAKQKLERSVASGRLIRAGETIEEADLILLSPGDGLRWVDRRKIVGKQALRSIPKHSIIREEDVQNAKTER
jgi:sialic acid synthase